jgi:serine protease Do
VIKTMLHAALMLASALSLMSSAQAQMREMPDFTALVEQQGPAVVNISVTQTAKSAKPLGNLPFDENDPGFEFFKRFFPHGLPGMPGAPGSPREFKARSAGSGFIISADGMIMTNAHVVQGADEVQVKLTDRREFKAKVLGVDRRTDVALIKIKAAGLPTVKLGDPEKLKVGEWVIAIGAPFGFDNSVTAGIVSAKGRSLPQDNSNYVPFIQTDAAINPGNSGGPLFNLRGEVVGINSQIYSRSGGYQGIAFAIPIDVAMEVQQQLKTTGKVTRGRLGVVIQDISQELADTFALSKPEGALVNSVERGGPADTAGILAGDVILTYNGKPVTRSADLPLMVGNTRPGQNATLGIWRKGKQRDFSVVVGEIKDDTPRSDEPDASGRNEKIGLNRLGLTLADLSPVQKKKLGIDGGVLIQNMRGLRGDLRSGDVILTLIHKGIQTPIVSVEQLNQALGKLDQTATFTLLVRRADSQIFVTLRGFGEQ